MNPLAQVVSPDDTAVLHPPRAAWHRATLVAQQRHLTPRLQPSLPTDACPAPFPVCHIPAVLTPRHKPLRTPICP
jgi:hypothetical protein